MSKHHKKSSCHHHDDDEDGQSSRGRKHTRCNCRENYLGIKRGPCYHCRDKSKSKKKKCPKGEKGDTGAQGPQGEKGMKGEQGPKGDEGDKGMLGDQGNKGMKGDSGGDKGDTGAKGAKGDSGGQKGEKGHQGMKGEIGMKGAQGPKGAKGEVGMKGVQGPKGDKGHQGAKGEVGMKGAKGEVGDKGAKGEVGMKGAKGEVGMKGEKGRRGKRGRRGCQGKPGQDGCSSCECQDFCGVEFSSCQNQMFTKLSTSGQVPSGSTNLEFQGHELSTFNSDGRAVPHNKYENVWLCTDPAYPDTADFVSAKSDSGAIHPQVLSRVRLSKQINPKCIERVKVSTQVALVSDDLSESTAPLNVYLWNVTEEQWELKDTVSVDVQARGETQVFNDLVVDCCVPGCDYIDAIPADEKPSHGDCDDCDHPSSECGDCHHESSECSHGCSGSWCDSEGSTCHESSSSCDGCGEDDRCRYVSVLLTSSPLVELALSCFELCVSSCCDGEKGEQGPQGPPGPAGVFVPFSCSGGSPPEFTGGFIASDSLDGSGPGYTYVQNGDTYDITLNGIVQAFTLSSTSVSGAVAGNTVWTVLVDETHPFSPASNTVTVVRPAVNAGSGFSFMALVCPTVDLP